MAWQSGALYLDKTWRLEGSFGDMLLALCAGLPRDRSPVAHFTQGYPEWDGRNRATQLELLGFRRAVGESVISDPEKKEDEIDEY